MVNFGLLQHWQNWLIVAFVFFLVSAVLMNCKKSKRKDEQ